MIIHCLTVIFFKKRIIKKAQIKRQQFKNLLVIGITGSYGKTSTKEFLAEILSTKFQVLKTKEHVNAEIGIAQTILNDLKKEHQIFIAEIATYYKGGVKEICQFLKPQIGIITGVNEQHLALFGSMENLLAGEGGWELIESLPEDGKVFLNGKNEICRQIYEKIKIKKYLYGQDAPLLKENIEGAKMVAKELGMSEEEIERAAEKIKNKIPGIEFKQGINKIKIIDATYSANPDGVMAHLEYLKSFPGKKVIIMPCLIELGKAAKEVHRRIGKKIAEVCDLAIITTKDRFKEIKEEAKEKAIFLKNPKKIFNKIESFCQENDMVFLEGRLSPEIIKLLTSKKFFPKIRPISISLSPNTEKDDIILAFKLLFQPWLWRAGAVANQLLEEEIKKYLGIKYAITFNSGRSALMAILHSLNFKQNDEILVQAFTCNAAINPIIWSGLKPIYVDCAEDTFNMDLKDLKRKISPRARAVIIQHTFGLPAEIDEILEICQKGKEDKSSSSPFADARENNLILIEDCAHALGAEYKGRKVGTFGQVAFLSFSRDKIISSVYGGAVVTNDEKLAQKIKAYQRKIGYPSYFWIKQQLLHPILMNWLILPTYAWGGKYLLVLLQCLNLLSKAVHWREKRGQKPNYFPQKMPNALAILALNQFKKIINFNQHRETIAQLYYSELKNTAFVLPPNPLDRKQTFLRFSIKHPQASQIIKEAWQKNLLIGDWYNQVIGPLGTKLEKIFYQLGSCPQAENLSKKVFNLPTHINISSREALKIVNFLKQWQ
ncbi:MAG: aminotransferase class I/II-fold pyridoxal phosphate-dependent enzyme [Minisyncoccia bacterium]